jgi:ankyrin repeat protein
VLMRETQTERASKMTYQIIDNMLIDHARAGRVKMVKAVLADGVNVHAQNDCALFWASYNGHVDVVKVLLAAGANVHADDDSALRWASQNGHVDVVEVLNNHIKQNS